MTSYSVDQLLLGANDCFVDMIDLKLSGKKLQA